MVDIVCSGCGGCVPDTTGPTHAYMTSAPGCWALFVDLLEWRGSLARRGTRAAQHLVDCFAVQHAANPDRRNRQSVAFHLMSLCVALEDLHPRVPVSDWTHREYPALRPRPPSYELTVRDVAGADPSTRPAVVGAMAESTWGSWEVHHAQVRDWLVDGPPPRVTRR